jgi:hypothetical protein
VSRGADRKAARRKPGGPPIVSLSKVLGRPESLRRRMKLLLRGVLRSSTGLALAVLEHTVVEGLKKLESTGDTIQTKTKVHLGTHGQVAREYRRLLLEEFRRAKMAP